MIENSIVYRNFRGKHDYLPVSKAEGCLIWDNKGKKYIDFTSGWNVTNLGWNHPEINEAIIRQTNTNVQSLLWGSVPIQEEYAAALTSALPKELDACMKATGGTEAIEMSIKVARTYTGRSKILGFKGTYHGQLFASLALGAPWEARDKIKPLVADITPIGFPAEDTPDEDFKKFTTELEEILSKKDIAAIVTEPGIITGGGSTKVAHKNFLKELRRLTEKYNTLLIIDEVGTGFSRTGKLFGIERENTIPDMVVFAKGISNGAAAIGTSVGKSEIFEYAFIDAILVSTFGWTPLGCAAALKTLQIHQRDKTWEMAESKGSHIKEKLVPYLGKSIEHIRGLGLEIGVGVKDDKTAQKIQKAAFKDGLHLTLGGGNNIQLMPPLTIPQKELEEGLEILISHLP